MDFLVDGPESAIATLILGHGAGAPMDSPWMNTMTAALVEQRFRVVRFEFPYMAARRLGQDAAPPELDDLTSGYKAAVGALATPGPVLIGGKSMSGAIGSMVADDLRRLGQVSGVVCFGFPFHAHGDPTDYRASHLETLETPAIIIQGAKDPLGGQHEAADFNLARGTELVWIDGADHDLAVAADAPATERNLKRAAREVTYWRKARSG